MRRVFFRPALWITALPMHAGKTYGKTAQTRKRKNPMKSMA